MRDYQIIDNCQPQKWEESVPIGCGRMGATIMCGAGEETLYLNEESIWSSRPGGEANPQMPEKIQAVRELLLRGKAVEANRMAKEILSGYITRIRSYEGAGCLKICLHESTRISEYRHSLDLVNGIASIEYMRETTEYKREYFASWPDQVIACRITASGAPIHAEIVYEHVRLSSLQAGNREILASARTAFGGHEFCVRVRVETDGEVLADHGHLFVENTSSLCVYISIATQFRFGVRFMEAAVFPECLDYEKLRARHMEDFRVLMSRADLSLPETEGMKEIPMTERLRTLLLDQVDDGNLVALQWQFSRYMLISTSRPGTLPTNLQGLWTKGNIAEWSSDYHLNINLQANYWIAESTNLSECHQPLFDYMNNYLLDAGKRMAAVGYGCKGCVVHHLSDIYGFAGIQGGLWGVWPHGASWLCLHLWEHYLYTQDVRFLETEAYAFIRQCALFYLDAMIENDSGYLVYGPSHSPENAYYAYDESGRKEACLLTINCAMDREIISCLLKLFLESSAILKIENAETAQADNALKKIQPLQIGRYGQLMEWEQDYEEVEIGHRHVSPGFALYPDSAINRSTPTLMRAVDVMLSRRLSGEKLSPVPGWTTCWIMAMYARMRKGGDAYARIREQQTGNIAQNLFAFNGTPMGDIFQIDGVMAFGAGVTEMLLQSHEGTIALLPALPKQWDHGSYYGLRARGNWTVSCKWACFSVTEFTVAGSGLCTVELPETQNGSRFRDQSGTVYAAQDNRICVSTDGTLTLVSEHCPANNQE